MSNKRLAVLTCGYTSYPQFMSVSSQIKLRILNLHPLKFIKALTCGYSRPLDKVGTLTNAAWATPAARTLGGVLLAGLCLCLTALPAASQEVTSKQIDYYKLYAHSLIIDAKQYRCVELLWDRESKWNPAAHNKSGGAYGIPQMKNKRIQYLDGFSQIRYGLKYIEHRYQTPCLAWAYWLEHRNY